jgi:hypothetical protein
MKKPFWAPFLPLFPSGPRARPISSLLSPLPRVGRRPALGLARRSDDFTRPSPFSSLASGTRRVASSSPPNIMRHVMAALGVPVLSWSSRCWGRQNMGRYLPTPPSRPILLSPSPLFLYRLSMAAESSWRWVPADAMNKGLSSSGRAWTGPWLGHDNTLKLPTHHPVPQLSAHATRRYFGGQERSRRRHRPRRPINRPGR